MSLPIHPACSMFCNCVGIRHMSASTLHTAYGIASEETDAATCRVLHDTYLLDPHLRCAPQNPPKVCHMCKTPLRYDLLSKTDADRFLGFCRTIERECAEIASEWSSRMHIEMEILHETILDEHLNIGGNLSHLRACLNTGWQGGLNGIIMVILAKRYERFLNAYLAEEEEEEKVDTPPHELPFIPPITIPTKKPYNFQDYNRPIRPNFWDGMSEEDAIRRCTPIFYDWPSSE